MAKANLTILHPSDGVEGGALRIKFYYQTDEKPCHVRLSFANQVDGAFDLDDGIECDIGFDGVSRLLSVLRGEADTLADGKPYDAGGGVLLATKRVHDGEQLVVAACKKDGSKAIKSSVTLKRHEITGLRTVFENSMFFFAFVKGVNS